MKKSTSSNKPCSSHALWQELNTESPADNLDSDFAEAVRSKLVKMGMFKPVPTELAETAAGRLTPLTPTDWSSERSSTSPSKFA